MSRKLLVADDSVTIQKVIKLALSSEGYDILTVSEGKEAIRAIQEEKPDVVLIDVSLPGADAYVVKRAINANPKLSSVGFILMLSAFERVDEDAIDSVKFQGRLIKPFDPSHLRKAVADVLSKKDQQPAPIPPPTPAASQLLDSLVPPEPPIPDEPRTPLKPGDLPPVTDMHPTVPDEPQESITEEEFPSVETTRLSLERPPEARPEARTEMPPPAPAPSAPDESQGPSEPKVFRIPTPDAATFDTSPPGPVVIPPAMGVSLAPPPPPPPAPVEEKTDSNLTVPEEAVARSLENDIKDLTESTIKMSGLDEWNLDDSRKMKEPTREPTVTTSSPMRVVINPPSPPPPPPVAAPPPPTTVAAPISPPPAASEKTRELTSPAIDKRAAILRSLMTPPAQVIDDGNTTFSLGSAKPPAPKTAPPKAEPEAPAAISSEIGLGREYVGPSVTPPPAAPAPAPSAKIEIPSGPSPAPPSKPGAEPVITRAEIEQMIRKDFESAIEKIAREAVPRIAEQILRQEIERILAEP